MTARKVLGLGPYHLAIEYNDPNEGPKTISAFPKGVFPRLWSTPDHLDEIGNEIVAEVVLPQGFTDREKFFAYLRGLDRGYCDCLDYRPWPGNQPVAYNSNSYVLGLLNAAGVTVDFRGYGYYGIDFPVPETAFPEPETVP